MKFFFPWNGFTSGEGLNQTTNIHRYFVIGDESNREMTIRNLASGSFLPGPHVSFLRGRDCKSRGARRARGCTAGYTARLRANYVNGRKGTFSYILDRLHALDARRKCARRAAGRPGNGSTLPEAASTASHDVVLPARDT